jgi:hypothetical protein
MDSMIIDYNKRSSQMGWPKPRVERQVMASNAGKI